MNKPITYNVRLDPPVRTLLSHLCAGHRLWGGGAAVYRDGARYVFQHVADADEPRDKHGIFRSRHRTPAAALAAYLLWVGFNVTLTVEERPQ